MKSDSCLLVFSNSLAACGDGFRNVLCIINFIVIIFTLNINFSE